MCGRESILFRFIFPGLVLLGWKKFQTVTYFPMNTLFGSVLYLLPNSYKKLVYLCISNVSGGFGVIYDI